MNALGLYFLAGAGAFALVALLTEAVRRLAVRYRLVDCPGRGKAHTTPTPLLGGMAIATGALAVATIASPSLGPADLALVVGGSLMTVLGLADDIWRLGVGSRLASEGLVASLVIASGVRSDVVGNVLHLGAWPDYAVSLLWIVVITNSFNLLDNSDGAAASIAMVTTAALTVLAFAAGDESLGLIQLAISAGCVGFLVHNWPPATIFMGDAGSLFLGFTISASSLQVLGSPGFPSDDSRISRACALLLLAFVAVVDTTTVIWSRHRAGRPLLRGGTDHTAHRLRALGFGAARSAILLSAAAALSCSAAILVGLGVIPAYGAIMAASATAVTMVALAQRVRVYDDAGAIAPAGRQAGLGAFAESAAGLVTGGPHGMPDAGLQGPR